MALPARHQFRRHDDPNSDEPGRPAPARTEPPPASRSAADAEGSGEDAAQEQRAEVRELSAPKGAVVYGAIHLEGEDELKRGTSALAWSGLAAGLSMGFSFVVEALLHHALPDTPWRPLVAKFGYSAGFLIVILGRQQLFTENTLTVILPLLRRRDGQTLWSVGRLWTAVLVANLVGAGLFALAIAWTSVLPSEVRPALSELGNHAMQAPFATTMVRGIFAGWLIALMVWLLPYAETSRVWVIIILTYIVGLGGFAHVIAGSVETLYLVATGERTMMDYVLRFLAPSLSGNIVGGVSLVAALAHAQFVAASDEGEQHVAVSG
ncbi:MAG: formate/nitrite transporter family protein [Acidobacteria bacterium]|nr:formate/nitrite transporter family protein [Acidobacteriota bacterium]